MADNNKVCVICGRTFPKESTDDVCSSCRKRVNEYKTVTMRRLCAWCRKDQDTGQQLTEAEYKEASPGASHGCCQECEVKYFKGEPKR